MKREELIEESMNELDGNTKESKKYKYSIKEKIAVGASLAACILSIGSAVGYYALKPPEPIPPDSYVPGEVIVNVNDIGDDWATFNLDIDKDSGNYYLHTKMGVLEAEPIFPHFDLIEEMSDYLVVKVPTDRSMEEILRIIGSEPWIDSVSPNYYVEIPDLDESYYQDFNSELESILGEKIPNDKYYHSRGSWKQPFEDMYGLKISHAEGAWKVTTGSDEVIIAVVDTGVDYTHPDIKDRMWKNLDEILGDGIDNDMNGFTDDFWGYDFTSDRPDPMDRMGHGTHVAGTIGATTDNKIGVAGVTWNGQIMPVKVLDDSGRGTMKDVAAGIVYAADNGAWVINMSLGGRIKSPNLVDEAIEYADSKGVITVVAAGNSNQDAKNFSPASNPLVITVAATDYQDKKASFSNWGECVDVSAPGVWIISTVPEKNRIPRQYPILDKIYGVLSGTSMASPHVAGEVGLILGANPELRGQRDAVKNIVTNAVDDFKSRPPKPIGKGRMNLEKAVQMAKNWH